MVRTATIRGAWVAAKAIAKGALANGRRVALVGRSLDREYIAANYLRGEGLEIGALTRPLLVPLGVNVTYVDRMPVDELRTHYPELDGVRIARVDVIDDGEQLTTIGSATQEFVIANHFLEHCQDPIRAIENLLRVLRDDGVLYLAVPDKRYTFDVDRPTTSFEHLLRDYREGPKVSRDAHFREWVVLVNKIADPAEAQRQVEALIEKNYSIHFHVWTQHELLEFFMKLRHELRFPIELEFVMNYKAKGETVVVVRKTMKRAS